MAEESGLDIDFCLTLSQIDWTLGKAKLGYVSIVSARYQVRLGQATLGYVSKVRLGYVRTCQVRLGQARLGQAKSGQVRLGQAI